MESPSTRRLGAADAAVVAATGTAANLLLALLARTETYARYPSVFLQVASATAFIVAFATFVPVACGRVARRAGRDVELLVRAILLSVAAASLAVPVVYDFGRLEVGRRIVVLSVSIAIAVLLVPRSRPLAQRRLPLVFATLTSAAVVLVWTSRWGWDVRLGALLAGLLVVGLLPHLDPGRVPLWAGHLGLLGLWLGGSALQPLPGLLRSADSSRSVVVITADTLRADDFALAATPALDRLAADATVWRNAWSAAPWTRPSVASLMTGLSAVTHGVSAGIDLPHRVETLAERLSAAGFETVAFVRNPNLVGTGFDQGFDRFYGYPVVLGRSWGDFVLRALRRVGRWPADDTSSLSADVMRWLRFERRGPFFLWVHFLDPHTPYHVPAELAPVGEPPGAMRPDRWDPRPDDHPSLGPRERAWVRALYRAEIRYVDREAGEILDELRRLDLYDSSLVVFTSDHGEEFWERGERGHGQTVHEEQLRVPLMFKQAGSSGRVDVETPVSTTSLVATMLRTLGLRVPSDDLSAGPLARDDGNTAKAQPVFADRPPTSNRPDWLHALRVGQLKLMAAGGEEEAYDLATDPGEIRPLAVPRDLDELLQEELGREQGRREHLEITEERSAPLSDSQLRDLRALGYLD